MKQSVAYLLPFMEAEKQGQVRKANGKIVMATVKGDVHDIGKNIVGVVLACNGFEVTDMGVMVPCDKILDKAIELGADVIGLSGLITPSLDEMVHVAKEMERRGFKVPLLVGGATTSAAHTAIKIAEHYSGAVVHVLDASRSVPVTTSLLSEGQKDGFIAENRAKQQTLRENFIGGPKKETLTLEQARAAGPKYDWDSYVPPVPMFLGTRVIRGAGVSPAASPKKPTFISDNREISKIKRDLPHWTQDQATYALTFRLVDSLPQSVFNIYLGIKKQWADLETLALSKGDTNLASDARKRLAEAYHETIEAALERGDGPDWLNNPEVAQLVVNAMKHFEGQRYELLTWCVMPNHVHAIIRLLGDYKLSSIIQSWKSFSAHECNRILNRTGGFWQQESYDHLIRGGDDFYNQRDYIVRHKTEWKGDDKEQDGGGRDARATVSLRELSQYIDWTPFFHAWELRGVWDRENKVLKTKNTEGATEAAKLYQDALEWIDRIIAEDRFQPQGIYGFFPANADGDDIIVWTDESRSHERCRFHTLRQQLKKDSGKPNVALSDWVAEKKTDFIGGFVVGIHGADEFAAELDAAHDPYGSIMVKAIADRFAEAFAELLHHRARIDWGYEAEGELTNDQLIHENYRGIRPAPGYPAQPDHTEKPVLFDLLGATDATGVTLTESCAMHPGAAVCGLYFSHPDSHYFVISELQKDQIEDYARRKGMSTGEAEKWLGPWLGYLP